MLNVYAAAWCPHCRRAVAFLKEKGVGFNYIDIEAQPDEVVAKVVAANGGLDWVVPTLEFNGKWCRGKAFDPGQLIEDLIDLGVIGKQGVAG